MSRLDLTLVVAWLLDPAKRKAFYGVLAAVSTLLVTLGVATDSLVTGATGVVVAVVDLLALVLASWKAQRADWTVIYGGTAAVVTALKVLGVLNDGQASHTLDVLAAGVAIMPLVFAFVRTDPRTPTGEPQADYVARHARTVQLAALPRED